MLSDKQRNELPRSLEDVYEELNDFLIRDISKRLKKTLEYTESALYDIETLKNQGFTQSQIQKAIMAELNSDPRFQRMVAEQQEGYMQTLKKRLAIAESKGLETAEGLLEEIHYLSNKNNEKFWTEAGMRFPNAESQILNALQVELAKELKNLTHTKGLIVKNGFVVSPLTKAYQQQLDLALIKLSNGVGYQTALKDCIKELAESGIRQVVYQNGKKFVTTAIDVACRRALLTASNQLVGNLMEENVRQSGVEYVETSSHGDSRPEHAQWQGKVFRLKGADKDYPNFYEATGYGTGAGLLGYNCRHTYYPFFMGISEPATRHLEKEVTVKDKTMTLYEATQVQRKYERELRALKRQRSALEEIGETDEYLDYTISRKQSAYRAFSKLAGIRPKLERATI